MEKTGGEMSRYLRYMWLFVAGTCLLIGLWFLLISYGFLGFMPTFEELENPKSNLASEVISADQVILGTYFNENRSRVEYNELSPYLINALLSTEDIRFKEHSGVDGKALIRVIWGIISGDEAGGGSTITQQLAKMLFPRENFSTIFHKINRKSREWVIAIKLEKSYTKDEIIAMYFNQFDFLNLAVGIKSAARVYFNLTPDSLNIDQAAMLVGMAKNPSLYNPVKRPDTTIYRRNVVLSQMMRYGFISQKQYDSLKTIPIKLHYQKVDHHLGSAPYFREYLRMTLSASKPSPEQYLRHLDYTEDSLRWENEPLYGWCNKNVKPDGKPYDLYKDGLKIYTTLNSHMQKYAEDAVKKHMSGFIQPAFFKEQKGREKAPFGWNISKKQIDDMMAFFMRESERYKLLKEKGVPQNFIEKIFHTKVPMKVFSWKGEKDTIMSPFDSIRYYKHFIQAGFMSMEPHTGYVRAYVGGIDYTNFQYDAIMLSRRQVGSTFKPFIYTLAMQDGVSPCFKVPNVPFTFEMPDGQPPYTPQFSTNQYTEKYDGKMITLKYGLANSLNQVSARVLSWYNPQLAIQMTRKMGVKSPIDPYYSICVGASEVLLSEMVGAYGTFANKGVYTEPIMVTRIEDKNGNVLATFVPKTRDAISEETAYLMIDLMRGVINSGTGIRLRYTFKFTADIAGKTGTTNNHSDGWFIGDTPSLVSGAWVGGEVRGIHFRGLDMGQGATLALPIWGYYMQKVYADSTLGYTQKERFDRPHNLSVETDCGKYEKEKNNTKGNIEKERLLE